MRVSIRPAVLLAALLGSTAGAQDPDDLAHYGTRPELPLLQISDLPPCVDGALIGRLRRTGERERIEAAPFRGSTRHWFEFLPRRTIFGLAAPTGIRFHVIGNPHLADRDNAVMLVRREPDGSLARAHVDLAIRDWRGREFIPLIWPPTPSLRGSSWLPIGFETFARRVHYDVRQMEAHGYDSTTLGYLAAAREWRGWVGWRGERAVVQTGIYLDELRAMFAEQRADQCWRPEPRLANPGSSR